MNLEPERKPASPGPQKYLRFFNLFMTLVYPAFGIYLLLSSPDQIQIASSTKKILGIMLIIYGLFRFYRTYRRKNQGL